MFTLTTVLKGRETTYTRYRDGFSVRFTHQGEKWRWVLRVERFPREWIEVESGCASDPFLCELFADAALRELTGGEVWLI